MVTIPNADEDTEKQSCTLLMGIYNSTATLVNNFAFSLKTFIMQPSNHC